MMRRRDFITLVGGVATRGTCATASHFPAISTRMCISLFWKRGRTS